jgi:very-short-patch-repair endonuclease
MSQGERLIARYLTGKNLVFHQEFLRTIRGTNRYFDFYVKELQLLIEFDGRQHFEDIPFFNKREKLSDRRLVDQEKINWALENKFHLVRIPYWQIDRIAEILDPIIEKLKSGADTILTVPTDYFSGFSRR